MSNNPFQGTQPLKLPSNDSTGPAKASLQDQSEQLPWSVRFVAPDQSIPVQIHINNKAFMGRADADSNYRPDIDLSEYGALEKGVSRRHAEIRAGKESLLVTDLASTNGTRINGRRLTPHEPYRLNHEDVLGIGAMEYEVHIEIMPIHEGVTIVKSNTWQLGKLPETPKEVRQRRILIVEDDPDTANAFSAMVSSLGYAAQIVHRTGEAMRAIASQVPDAVFVDLNMPDFPGTEICRMIKNDLANEHVPIFAISGDTEESAIRSALEAGADIFLSKPLGLDQLIENLQKYVGSPTISVDE